MARNRKKVSLYEVIGRSQPKPGYDRILTKRPPEKTEKPEPKPAKSGIPGSGRPAYWPRKPKLVQFNAGRIEISIPYQIAIALVLGLILLILVGFRLGRSGYLSGQKIFGSASKEQGQGPGAKPGNENVKNVPDEIRTEKIDSTGNNRIVIQTYQARADLEPVKTHFARFGIETEIRKIGDTYYLVSKNKYENPNKEGTDGYIAKQKIIEVGALYRAPQGYEPFGVKSFETAFGKKFED